MPTADTYLYNGTGWRNLRTGAVIGAARFPGDPGLGQPYYVGWAEDDGAGVTQTLPVGQAWTTGKTLSLWHTYSNAADERIEGPNIRSPESGLDYGITNNCVVSQSIKLLTWSPAQIVTGLADAALTDSAAQCIARAPHPIWVCYYHEPEDNFEASDQQSTDFRAATRYMVQRFRDEGVTNVAWMPILQAPWSFRSNPPVPSRPGGGSGRDWRRWHADWNGGNTGTGADWHEDRMMDFFGVDVYNPLVGGTSNQDFVHMMDDTFNLVTDDGFYDQGGVCTAKGIFEFGISNVATPTPDWVAWCTAARDYMLANDFVCVTYWNNNDNTPRRYDFTAASDPDGTKLQGWNIIAAAGQVWTP